MAFNYQTLKKLTNAAVIADEVKTADIGSLEVKSGKIKISSFNRFLRFCGFGNVLIGKSTKNAEK